MKKLLKRTKFLREGLKNSLQQVSVEDNEVSKMHDMKSSELYFQDEKQQQSKPISTLDNRAALKKKLKKNQRRLPDDSDGEDYDSAKRRLSKTDSNTSMNIQKGIQPEKKEISHGTYDLWGDDVGNTKNFITKGETPSLNNRKTPLPHPGQSYNPDPIEHQNALHKILKNLERIQKETDKVNGYINTPKSNIEETIVSNLGDSMKEVEEADSAHDTLSATTSKERKKLLQMEAFRNLKQKLSKNNRKFLSKKKLSQLNFERARLSKIGKKKRKEPSIEKIVSELKEEYDKKKIKKIQKKQRKINRSRYQEGLQSVEDVYLTDELPGSLRAVGDSSRTFWNSKLAELKDSGLFFPKVKKILNSNFIDKEILIKRSRRV